MARLFYLIATVGVFAGVFGSTPAIAWDRGEVKNFATIPFLTSVTPSMAGPVCPDGAGSCTSDIEGVAVGPDGTVYSATFGFNSDGALGGNGVLFVFAPNGKLLRQFPVPGSSPHLIGLVFQQSTGNVLVADLGLGVVWAVNPVSGATSKFMTAPSINGGSPGLNALTIDKSGNVYTSDSFQGVIWKNGPGGGTPTAWYSPAAQNDLLLPTANDNEPLIPPFGANGIEFNNEGTALFAMNTAYHSIIKIPVNPDDGSAGTGTVFTTGLNAPDGLAVDANDNLWVAANQGDEIVVVNTNDLPNGTPKGTVIAKKGDFDGIAPDGSVKGLLFPASVAFSPDKKRLYVTNLALYLPSAGAGAIAVDSGLTLQVKRYNIGVIETPAGP